MTGPEESGGTRGGRGVPAGAGCGRAARESAVVSAYLGTKSAVRRGASAARSLALLRGVSAALAAAGPGSSGSFRSPGGGPRRSGWGRL